MTNKFFLTLFLASSFLFAKAQNLFSEGTIHYNISVVEGSDKSGLGKAFAGATQVVSIKGYKARIDFSSSLRNQSVIYDAQAASGFILRQSGTEKYLIPLNANQWLEYNKKYKGVNFTNTTDRKVIEGENCLRATGKLADGSEIEVWYSPNLTVLAKGYDLVFANLNGLPLEYTVANGSFALRYTAILLKPVMVSAANFDVPKSGYKLLEFQSN